MQWTSPPKLEFLVAKGKTKYAVFQLLLKKHLDGTKNERKHKIENEKQIYLDFSMLFPDEFALLVRLSTLL